MTQSTIRSRFEKVFGEYARHEKLGSEPYFDALLSFLESEVERAVGEAKKRVISDEEIGKWAERHYINLGKIDLRQAFEDATSLHLSPTEEKNVVITHGRVTHSIEEAEDCPTCQKVQEHFEKAKESGELDRILTEEKGKGELK